MADPSAAAAGLSAAEQAEHEQLLLPAEGAAEAEAEGAEDQGSRFMQSRLSSMNTQNRQSTHTKQTKQSRQNQQSRQSKQNKVSS